MVKVIVNKPVVVTYSVVIIYGGTNASISPEKGGRGGHRVGDAPWFFPR